MPDRAGNRTHDICDYEGSSYRAEFWDGHGREYEDLAERIAIRRLLPPRGSRLIDIGAGFGRLADLYSGYDQVVLVDYAKSGLREAQLRLAYSSRFVFVAADIYRLPIAPAACDVIVSVRVLHHLANVPDVLPLVAQALRPGGTYLLEYANKRNAKSILRYLTRRQRWSPFNAEPFEFHHLHFDFHPSWMEAQLKAAGFSLESGLAVSHFRQGFLKKRVSPAALAGVDGAFQRPGALLKLSPSLFIKAQAPGSASTIGAALFCCPSCRSQDLREDGDRVVCSACGSIWAIDDGIYDFKTPLGRAS